MARRDTKTAYGIIAVGLIILVAALTCMLLNKKDTLCSTAARPSANQRRRSASRLGEPTAFSPIESCMVGYDYGI